MGSLLAGRYQIEDPLGQGGMGSVFRATQLGLDRKVAVKLLEVEGADAHARFQREAKLVARLHHPAIVQVIDYGIDAGQAFLVMEFVEGVNLESLVVSGEHIEAPRLVEVAASVLEALFSAHQMGVVHRDVKPANIMLRGGARGPPVLLDFGIARAELEQDSKITRAGIVMGTAAYMSPEQTRGERVDGRADVYSLACTLYELASGRPPFIAPNAADVLAAHLYREPPRLENLIEKPLPLPLVNAIMRGLAKSPSDRCTDALEYASILRDSLVEKTKRGAIATHRDSPTTQSGIRAIPTTGAKLFIEGAGDEAEGLRTALALANIEMSNAETADVHLIVVGRRDAVHIARARAASEKHIPLLLAVNQINPAVLADAISAGVHDVLLWPPDATKAVSKILSAARKRSRS
jgi:eukaryotic-like serine/threonine-protein kinase